MHRMFLLPTLLAFIAVSGDIRIDTLVSIHADATLPVFVHLPDRYESDAESTRWPVIYLLHCAGCRGDSWHGGTYSSNVTPYADSLDAVIVAVDDGNRLGWWLDSPEIENSDMSRFLVEEVKPHIDATYRTIDGPGATGVAGHSMGGYGALHNLIEHPEVFGAAFSIKGLVNLYGWIGTYNWRLDELLGNYEIHAGNWQAADIVRNAYRLKGREQHVAFYSGQNDWFGVGNRMLHDTLKSMGVPHYDKTYDKEAHYDVPPERLSEVMWYFDSVLVSTTRVRNFEKKSRMMATATPRRDPPVLYDLRGRKHRDVRALNSSGARLLLFESSGNVTVRLLP